MATPWARPHSLFVPRTQRLSSDMRCTVCKETLGSERKDGLSCESRAWCFARVGGILN